MTSAVITSTYNDATNPNYGLVFNNGSNTVVDVWGIMHHGPAHVNGGLEIRFANSGGGITNLHSATTMARFVRTGDFFLDQGKFRVERNTNGSVESYSALNSSTGTSAISRMTLSNSGGSAYLQLYGTGTTLDPSVGASAFGLYNPLGTVYANAATGSTCNLQVNSVTSLSASNTQVAVSVPISHSSASGTADNILYGTSRPWKCLSMTPVARFGSENTVDIGNGFKVLTLPAIGTNDLYFNMNVPFDISQASQTVYLDICYFPAASTISGSGVRFGFSEIKGNAGMSMTNSPLIFPLTTVLSPSTGYTVQVCRLTLTSNTTNTYVAGVPVVYRIIRYGDYIDDDMTAPIGIMSLNFVYQAGRVGNINSNPYV